MGDMQISYRAFLKMAIDCKPVNGLNFYFKCRLAFEVRGLCAGKYYTDTGKISLLNPVKKIRQWI